MFGSPACISTIFSAEEWAMWNPRVVIHGSGARARQCRAPTGRTPARMGFNFERLTNWGTLFPRARRRGDSPRPVQKELAGTARPDVIGTSWPRRPALAATADVPRDAPTDDSCPASEVASAGAGPAVEVRCEAGRCNCSKALRRKCLRAASGRAPRIPD